MLDFYKKQPPKDVQNESPTSGAKRHMSRFHVSASDLQKRRIDASERLEKVKTRTLQPRVGSPTLSSQGQLDFATTDHVDLLSQHLVPLTPLPESNPCHIHALAHNYCKNLYTVTVYIYL
jgi:hypothetical protein